MLGDPNSKTKNMGMLSSQSGKLRWDMIRGNWVGAGYADSLLYSGFQVSH